MCDHLPCRELKKSLDYLKRIGCHFDESDAETEVLLKVARNQMNLTDSGELNWLFKATLHCVFNRIRQMAGIRDREQATSEAKSWTVRILAKVAQTFVWPKGKGNSDSQTCFIAYCRQAALTAVDDISEELRPLDDRSEEVTREIRVIQPAGQLTAIEIPNHGLTGGENLRVVGSSSVPSIDCKEYRPQVRVKDRAQEWYVIKDRDWIEISRPISEGGNQGAVKFNARSGSVSQDVGDRSETGYQRGVIDRQKRLADLIQNLRNVRPNLSERDISVLKSSIETKMSKQTPTEAADSLGMSKEEWDTRRVNGVTWVVLTVLGFQLSGGSFDSDTEGYEILNSLCAESRTTLLDYASNPIHHVVAAVLKIGQDTANIRVQEILKQHRQIFDDYIQDGR